VGGMVVRFVEYVAGVDIVPVIPGHGIHRPAPHQAVVVPGKQPNFLSSKVCRRIDSAGGFVRSLGCAIANVETYEFRYPLLYLYRRQECDTGGPGKFRGGAAIGLAMTPHDVEEIPTCVLHGCGIEQPASAGIAGGYPGSTTQFNIRRKTSVQELLSRGQIPVEFNALDGELQPKPETPWSRPPAQRSPNTARQCPVRSPWMWNRPLPAH